MDSTNNTTVRNMLATGDLAAVIDALSPDEHATFTLTAVRAGEPANVITLARIGQLCVSLEGGTLKTMVLDTEDAAITEFAYGVEQIGTLTVQHNDAARLIQLQAQMVYQAGASSLDGPTVDLSEFGM